MVAYDQSLKSREDLAGALEVALINAGFHVVAEPGEVCYTRLHNKIKDVQIRVYTTIPQGLNMVRDVGKDAIRVCAIYTPMDIKKRRGLFKESRVYRYGEIEEIVIRTIQRARDVWATISKIQKCPKCNSITFESKAGKKVCANLCWLKETSK